MVFAAMQHSMLHLFCLIDTLVVSGKPIRQRHYLAAFDALDALRAYLGSAVARSARECERLTLEISSTRIELAPAHLRLMLASALRLADRPSLLDSATPEDGDT